MSERRTIARPYAAAAFQTACEQNRIDSWSQALRFMAAVSEDGRVRNLLVDRTRTKAAMINMFIDVCGDQIDEYHRNFVRVAAENGRLPLLSEISEMYEELRAEHERRINAEVISAFPLSASHRKHISSVVKERFGKEITLKWETNSDLLGGIVVRAQDTVIDASVDGWLTELANSLAQ